MGNLENGKMDRDKRFIPSTDNIDVFSLRGPPADHTPICLGTPVEIPAWSPLGKGHVGIALRVRCTGNVLHVLVVLSLGVLGRPSDETFHLAEGVLAGGCGEIA